MHKQTPVCALSNLRAIIPDKQTALLIFLDIHLNVIKSLLLKY